MDELREVRNALDIEKQDCYNQGDRVTAATIERICNALDRAMLRLTDAQEGVE